MDTNNKPISMIVEESRQIIVDAINNANLHPTLLLMILKDIYNEVNQQAKIQYEYEKIEYEKMLTEIKNEVESDKEGN